MKTESAKAVGLSAFNAKMGMIATDALQPIFLRIQDFAGNVELNAGLVNMGMNARMNNIQLVVMDALLVNS